MSCWVQGERISDKENGAGLSSPGTESHWRVFKQGRDMVQNFSLAAMWIINCGWGPGSEVQGDTYQDGAGGVGGWGGEGRTQWREQAAEGMYAEAHGLLLLLPTGSHVTDSSPASTAWKTFLMFNHSLNEIWYIYNKILHFVWPDWEILANLYPSITTPSRSRTFSLPRQVASCFCSQFCGQPWLLATHTLVPVDSGFYLFLRSP